MQPQAHAPLRIFLSYGHDSNEELVRRIKIDLEKRGHDVWFDKSEIKAGHDWRRSITEGILDSHRVLSFLSKYSTRDPGVCLDEISIAIGAKGGNIQTILVENEREVKPPASISHVQWLDMHDWKEQRETGEPAWEKWYQAKLAEIVAVIESDEGRRFAGEIKTLEQYLKPISSDARMGQLLKKPLVGRKWLFEALEQWRTAADRSSRLFWIMGAPGVGKSAFAADLVHYRGDKVIAVQFCEYDKPDHRDAARIVRTLAFQIATRVPDYRKRLLTLPEIGELDRKNSSELFDYLLAGPLGHAIDGGRDRYLIVIDALDEAEEAGRNVLAEMLARNAQRLPEWIGIVVTSRPESTVKTPLQGLNPLVLDTSTATNRADLREYLLRELASQIAGCPNPNDTVEQVLEESEGVFLYVERFCDDIVSGHLFLDHPERFPRGLGGTFFQWFQRLFPDLEEFRKDIRPALRAILAAREPLPVETLQRLFEWPDEELRDFTRKLGSMFPASTESWSGLTHGRPLFYFGSMQYATPKKGQAVISAYHKSLADWLANADQAGCYFVSPLEGHRILSDLGWTEFGHYPRSMSAYFICNLPQHLIAIGDTQRLQDVLNDQWFWEHSPVFYRDEFYASIASVLTPAEALVALAPVHSFYAEQAVTKSPAKLGYTLFPHEPGANFVNGTPCDGYMIPYGAKDPPSDVLWDFIKTCHGAYLSASAFLRGAPSPTVAEWYRAFWRNSGLQDTLDDIDRYYGFHHQHLSHRASELSFYIDEVLKQVSSINPAIGAAPKPLVKDES